MALAQSDRVLELTTTAGTGTLSLGGSPDTYQTFASGVGDGNTTYYAIVVQSGTDWEVGLGTYTASGNTLSRDTVLDSSNGGALVNFPAGTKSVFVTYPADKTVLQGAAATFTTLTATGQTEFQSTSVGGPTQVFLRNSAQTSGYMEFAVTDGTRYAELGLAKSGVNGYGNANEAFLRASGSTTGLNISSSSSNPIRFSTGAAGSSTEQLRVINTANAVNYVQVTGAATNAGPIISAQGSDANAELQYRTKGIYNHVFQNGSGAANFIVDQTAGASVVNRLQASGALTNFAPRLSAQGSDTNISMAFQSKGTGAIDLAAGSSGVNISNGGTVTALTITNNGTTAYTSHPTPAITAPTTAGGVQATATSNLYYNSALATTTIISGGSGYTLNDVMTVSGGTFTTAATFIVSGVSGGVVTAITSTSGGTYSAIPTGTLSVTGGTGTGFTLTINGWAVRSLNITNAGSGYVEQPTVTFSGGGGSGAAAYATVGSGSVIRALGATGTQALDIYTPSSVTTSNPALRFRDSSGSDSYPMVWNFGGQANIIAQGNANASMFIGANGTGGISFSTSGTSTVQQLRVAHTASAVNYVQVTGGATGGAPVISAQGSDTNVSLVVSSKGSGQLYLGAGSTGGSVRISSAGAEQFVVGGSSASVNKFQTRGAATGFSPLLWTFGSDTNVGFEYSTTGTGAHTFWTNDRNGGTGAQQFAIAHTASAVNYVQVTGGATGAKASITGQGADSAVGLLFNTKGTAFHEFQVGNRRTFQIGYTTGNDVNYLQVQGNATTAAPILSAQGTDTNIDLALTPKGTGLVRFGTQFANYITASGAATTAAPTISAAGSDASVALAFASKNGSNVTFDTGTSSAANAFTIAGVGSGLAVYNGFTMTPTTSGGIPTFAATGANTDVNMNVYTKGAGYFAFRTQAGSATQVFIKNTTSAVNRMELTGSTTGNGVTLNAAGSDTNVDINVVPKGSGKVSFKTDTGYQLAACSVLNVTGGGASHIELISNYTVGFTSSAAVKVNPYPSYADADLELVVPTSNSYVKFGAFNSTFGATISGYITIKDSSGTLRKLAVIY